MKIGIAGIGKMGAAIAARLAGLGHAVTEWNRTAATAQALGGTLPVAARALECFDEASREGFGKGDATLLPVRWASKSARQTLFC